MKKKKWGRMATFLKGVKEGIWEEETSAEMAGTTWKQPHPDRSGQRGPTVRPSVGSAKGLCLGAGWVSNTEEVLRCYGLLFPCSFHKPAFL